MNYALTKPCAECPFLVRLAAGYALRRLNQFASGEFPCHKASVIDEEKDGYVEKPDDKTPHCAGALIFLEKRNRSHQMMRICERLGYYDRTKLDMTADVR